MSLEIIGISAALAAYTALATTFLNRIRKRKVEREYEQQKKNEEFVETLEKALQNGALQDLEDVHNFYLGHFHLPKLTSQSHRDVTRGLRVLASKIASHGKIPGNMRREQHEAIKALIRDSVALQDMEDRKLPFTAAPSPERGLLSDILELSDKTNDLLPNKLQELSNSIIARQETIDALNDEKGKSLKWAKWGVFGTVFFSAVSIGLTVWNWQ